MRLHSHMSLAAEGPSCGQKIMMVMLTRYELIIMQYNAVLVNHIPGTCFLCQGQERYHLTLVCTGANLYYKRMYLSLHLHVYIYITGNMNTCSNKKSDEMRAIIFLNIYL